MQNICIREKVVFAFCAIFLSSLCAYSACGGSTIYVDDDASAGGNGASWNTAYRFLQDAMVIAGAGTEIRVAQGLYLPDHDEANPDGTGDREVPFVLNNGVAVLGGYAGIGAKDPDARDIAAYETILSGDLLGDDEPVFQNRSDNSKHVVTTAFTGNTTVINGVTISSGFAHNPSNGGGFHNLLGSPIIQDCTFRSNFADSGGGGFFSVGDAQSGTPTLINCVFDGNHANNSWGGGIWIQSGIAMITGCTFVNNTGNWGAAIAVFGTSDFEIVDIINTTFVSNSASQGGAGIYSNGADSITVTNCQFLNNDASSNPGGGGAALLGGQYTITDCEFIDNTSIGRGGGLYLAGNNENATNTISNCSFVGNIAQQQHGGAIFITSGGGSGLFQVHNCTFIQNEAGDDVCSILSRYAPVEIIDGIFIANSATHGGGGIYVEEGSLSTISCTFLGNTSMWLGGALYDDEASPLIVNCLFSGNVAQIRGGAISSILSNPVILDSTIVANQAIDFGGGIRNYNGTVTIANSILWGNEDSTGINEDSQILNQAGGITNVNYSCIEGLTGNLGGVGNIGLDPLFVDADGLDDVAGTEDDDLHMQLKSPCLSSGDNALLPQDIFDLDGDDDDQEPLPVDIEGNDRVLDKIVDMGSFEISQAPPPGEYIGPKGGSWFDPENWEGGVVPDETTNVYISTEVLIGQFGAVAADVTIRSGGNLFIGLGSLVAMHFLIEDGGALSLTDPMAILDIQAMTVDMGGTINWAAGTINLTGGTWNHAQSLPIGCEGAATLNLYEGAMVIAVQIQVCADGIINGDGSLVCDVINDGEISPGFSAGSLIVTGSFVQSAIGVLTIDIEGLTPAEYDRLEIDGSAILDGTVNVLASKSLDPMPAQLEFISASPISGAFDTVNLPDPVGEFEFSFEQDSMAAKILLTSNVPQGSIIYVNAGASEFGTGTSWANALVNLQDALDVAEDSGGLVSDMWVATGLYVPFKPTVPQDPRSVTFQLIEDLAVYGGFAGGEQNLEERDFVNNVTILSGDIDGDDGPNFTNNNDNAYHIVTAINTNNSAVLDGFTVIGGNTLGAQSTTGAGIYCLGGHPVIANCRIELNRGYTGSGLYSQNGGVDLINCIFENNSNAPPGNASGDGGGAVIINGTGLISGTTFIGNSTSGSGGGLYADGSHLVLFDCDFTGNLATSLGGGAYCLNGTVDAIDCTFVANTFYGDTSVLAGGGMGLFNVAGSIENCVFENNIANDVGGLGLGYCGSNVTITGCSFVNNISDYTAGGLGIERSSPMVIDCSFIGNSASSRGGGVYTGHNTGAENNPVFEECTFESNSSARGGGMYSLIGVTTLGQGPTLNSCTFINNNSTEGGGGIRNQGAELRLNDCTFQGNTAPVGSGLYNIFDGSIFGNSIFTGSDEFVSTDPVNPGFLTPGAEIGTIAVEGAFRLIDRGTGFEDNPSLSVDLAGVLPETEHDYIDVGNGVVELDGTLFVNLINDFEPAIGDNFQLINANSTLGQFDLAFFPELPVGSLMTINTQSNGVTLQVDPVSGEVLFADPNETGITGIPTDSVLGDFDDDGDLDLAVTIEGDMPSDPGRVIMVRNAGVDGKGNWIGFTDGSTEITVGIAPSSLISGYFNNDASLDLAVANFDDNSVSILLNDAKGTGTFVLDQTYAVGAGPMALSTGLLNDDADIDLAVANSDGGSVTLMYGNGSGGFAIAATISTGDAPADVALLDIDNDGDTDLVVLNQGTLPDPIPTLAVHVSLGLGVNFEIPVFYDVGATPIDLLVADLNNNGFSDLACTNSESDTASIFVNYGKSDGLYSQPSSLPIGNQPSSIVSMDFDSDGDLDLVVLIAVSESESIIRLARNDLIGGTIVFGEFSDLSSGPTVLIRAGDVDNDGQPDIIAINDGEGSSPAGGLGSSISVHINSTNISQCPWDLDGSGSVSTGDLLALFTQWGTDGPADFDGSGAVGTGDLLILFANWGPCP